MRGVQITLLDVGVGSQVVGGLDKRVLVGLNAINRACEQRLGAAQVVADKLKALPGTKDDPDVLAAMAAVSAGRGNFAAAAEMQYDAWMAAAPAAKPAVKRALESYEAKAKDPKATAK